MAQIVRSKMKQTSNEPLVFVDGVKREEIDKQHHKKVCTRETLTLLTYVDSIINTKI